LIEVSRVSSAQEALDLWDQEFVDVVLIYVQSLDAGHIALIKALEQKNRPKKIVIVSQDSRQVAREPAAGSNELSKSDTVSQSSPLHCSASSASMLCRLHQHELFENLKSDTNRQVRVSLRKLFAEITGLGLDLDAVRVVSGGVLFLTYGLLAELGYCADEIYGLDFRPLETIAAMKSAAELESFFAVFLARACKAISDHNGNTNRKKIEAICHYMQENYVTDVSLSTLAKRYRMSPSYLSSLFAKSTGQTFTTYLTNCRISKAKEILKHTDKRIYEVAMEVGFKDPYYFSNRFKQVTGNSPSEYRERVVKQ